MPGNNGNRWFRDMVFVLVLLLISSALLLLSGNREEGGSVRVEVEGRVIARYSLSESGRYVLNGGTNILVIEDGKAYMEDADCPDKLCVKQGRIYRKGETITCLPNKLMVTVEKKASPDDVEIIL